MKSKLQIFFPAVLIGSMILIPIMVLSYDIRIEKPIDFETIARGSFGNYGKHNYFVIDSQIEWDHIWYQTFGSHQTVPNIDFILNTVIAVYFGGHSTGGYTIEITSIRETALKFHVYVEETSPSPEKLVPQVITSPFHIIKTQKLMKEVIFECECLIK